MSAAAVRRFVANAPACEIRRCACGTTFVAKKTDPRTACAGCRERAARRAREARWRADPTCRACGDPLAAANSSHLCGFCVEERAA